MHILMHNFVKLESTVIWEITIFLLVSSDSCDKMRLFESLTIPLIGLSNLFDHRLYILIKDDSYVSLTL